MVERTIDLRAVDGATKIRRSLIALILSVSNSPIAVTAFFLIAL